MPVQAAIETDPHLENMATAQEDESAAPPTAVAGMPTPIQFPSIQMNPVYTGYQMYNSSGLHPRVNLTNSDPAPYTPPAYTFSHANGVSFPSPSTVTNLPAGQINHISSLPSQSAMCYSTATMGIQFPSPYYCTSSTTYTGNGTAWQTTVPRTMPWAPRHNGNNVVQFHGSSAPSLYNHLYGSASKRKIDDDDEGLHSAKIHVNEERMAARMQGLHLDNNNLDWTPNLEESWLTRGPSPVTSSRIQPRSSACRNEDEDEEEVEMSSSSRQRKSHIAEPRLKLSKELELGLKTKQLLSKPFLEEITKSSLQVVLWQPPGDQLKHMLQDMREDTSLSESLKNQIPLTANQGLCSATMDMANDTHTTASNVAPPGWGIPAGAASDAFNNTADSADDDMDL